MLHSARASARSIHDADCDDRGDIELLYAFYTPRKKKEVMARKKAVPTEDIPPSPSCSPRTDRALPGGETPGRLWLLNRPASKLREHMTPTIHRGRTRDRLPQTPSPRKIRLLDPAVGQRHMLTYAFDLLSLIYAEELRPQARFRP